MALYDILEKDAYANLRLKEVSPEHAAWVSAAVYVTLDHLYYIDYLLSYFARGHLKPIIRCLLRLGFAQVLYMDVSVPAACDESVKLSQEIGKGALSGFVNGVMRSFCRSLDALPPLPAEPRQRLSVQHSYPRWLVDMYVDKYGMDFTEAMLSCRLSGLSLRTQWPYETEAFCTALQARGLTYSQGKLVPDALRVEGFGDPAQDPLFIEGMITVQSESAMLVCQEMDVKAGQRILDACAAPGGKSAYISALMHGTGHIDAWELHPHRAELTRKTLSRLHVQNVTVSIYDATKQDPSFAAAYDAVLVDAPCSGFGVTGKPDIRYAKSEEILCELAAIQKRLLASCCAYVRPGGLLLYATCTISEKENGAQIRDFLAAQENFSLEHERQLFPHIDQCEGFYYAKMRRDQ